MRKTSRPQYSLRNRADVEAYLSDAGLRKNLADITAVALSHLQKGVAPGILFGSPTDVEKFGETATCFSIMALEVGDLQLAELMISCLEALGGALHAETVKYLASDPAGRITAGSGSLDLASLREDLARRHQDEALVDQTPPDPEPCVEAHAVEVTEPSGQSGLAAGAVDA